MTTVLAPVYGDVLLFIEFCLELVLLWAAGRLAGARTSVPRLAGAAAAGALYSLGFVAWGGVPLYHPAARLAAGAGVAAAAFAPLPLPHLARVVGWFYALSALAAGVALGLDRLSGPAVGAAAWWPLGLAAGLVLCLTPRAAGWRRALALPGAVVPVTLWFAGRSGTVWGLVDTGHRLRDPVTGAPVILAEAGSLEGLLPGVVAAGGGVASLADLPSGWRRRVRLVSCRTALASGLLPGFRADRVVVEAEGGRRTWRRVTVALTGERLSGSGRYQALVPPRLVGAMGRGGESLDGEGEAAARAGRTGPGL